MEGRAFKKSQNWKRVLHVRKCQLSACVNCSWRGGQRPSGKTLNSRLRSGVFGPYAVGVACMAAPSQGKEMGCTFGKIFQISYWGGWGDTEAGQLKGYCYRLGDLKKHPSNSFIL